MASTTGGSKIPVPVVSGVLHRGHSQTMSPVSNSGGLAHRSDHHPHYNNHRSPQHRPVSASPPVPIELPVNQEQQLGAKNVPSPPKFEAFMMTGDLIINLANRESRTNLIQSQFTNNQERMCFRRRKQRTTPDLHSSSIQLGHSEPTPRRESAPSATITSGSLPNSPAAAIEPAFPIEQKKLQEPLKQPEQSEAIESRLTPDASQADQGARPNRSSFRLSRSEDHLLNGGGLEIVDFEADLDMNNQSNSLDMLMDTEGKPVENAEEVATGPLSTSSSSTASHSAMNGSSRSDSPSEGTTGGSSTATKTRSSGGSRSRTNSVEDEENSGATSNSTSSSCSTGGARASSKRTKSMASSSSGSYTATTTTPPEGTGFSSSNCSPTKAISGFSNTNVDQTESSMSEGYSVVSSMSGPALASMRHFKNNHRNQQQQNQQNQGQNGQARGSHHVNTLSLSSSCESSAHSSTTASPQDFATVTLACDETLLDAGRSSGPCLTTAPRLEDLGGSGRSSTVGGDSSATELDQDSPAHSGNSAKSPARINGHGDATSSQVVVDHGPRRYPSFITPEFEGTGSPGHNGQNHQPQQQYIESEFELSRQSIQPPPVPSLPPPLHSPSPEGDQSSEEDDPSSTFPGAIVITPPKAVDVASASRLAKRLFRLEGFKKSDVSRHLSKNNDFARVVAEEYLKLFAFEGDTVDGALRKFLSQFCLIGETQERERVLVHFARRFLDCNPGSFKSADAVHTLTCAIMMLNTDLHGENVGRKMTSAEFVENLADLHEGENFPKDTLRALYASIKNQALQWAYDSEEEKQAALNGRLPSPGVISMSADGSPAMSIVDPSNPFLEVSNGSSAAEYKRGYIMRKSCFEANGKRTPLGKRGWKMFYATLRDLVLYLHKDEQGFRKNQLYESLHNSARIHHALATKATDYSKKEFVFRLQTADQAEYLFQTSDARELQSWVDTINMVAASLSAPPLAPAVGSQTRKFQRPLLPVSHTKFNIRDQLMDIEKRLGRMESELESHLSKPPERSASRGILNEYSEKEAYLQYELKRYRTYSNLLKMKIQQQLGAQVLDKVVKGAILMSAKPSKPLTSLAIGEEMTDEEAEAGDGQGGSRMLGATDPESGLKVEEPVIKPVKRSDRYSQQKRLR